MKKNLMPGEKDIGKCTALFGDCVGKLVDFSLSPQIQLLENELLEGLDDILESKEDNKVIDFLKEVVKSNVEIDYLPLGQNPYLSTLRNLVNTILSSLECITEYIGVLSEGFYETAFFYQFIKKFGIRIVLFEVYKRVVLFSKVKKMLVLQ